MVFPRNTRNLHISCGTVRFAVKITFSTNMPSTLARTSSCVEVYLPNACGAVDVFTTIFVAACRYTKSKQLLVKPGSLNLGGQILRSYTPTEAFYLRQDSIFPKRWCLFSLIIKKSIVIITIIIVSIIIIINIIIINIIIIIILVIIIVINISLDFNCIYTCNERPAVSSKIPFSVFIYLSLRLSLLGAHWNLFYPQARKVDLQVRFMETMFRYETHHRYVYPFIA